jgi:DNA-binding FadR family transcriptional regulator
MLVEPFILIVSDRLPARSTAVDASKDALLGHVLSGAVPPGGHLPPECELSAQLGVDRGTLRPAIAPLVSRGLLTQRQGRGTVVQDIADSGGLDLLAPVIARVADSGDARAVVAIARDLLRLRRHLATALLERVVEAADAGEHIPDAAIDVVDARIADLAVAWQAHGAGARAGVADAVRAVVEADLAVLRAVVHAVSDLDGGLVFALALNPVRQALFACPPLQRAIAADLGESVVGWSVVVAFLKAPSSLLQDGIVAGLRERDARTLALLAPPAQETAR